MLINLFFTKLPERVGQPPVKISNLLTGFRNMKEKAELTLQEMKILESLSAGASNTEISRSLDISVNTVKFHLKSIYRKLNTRNRVEAAGRFRQIQLQNNTEYSITNHSLS